ncbi:hypothetical protein [Corynebacterium suranareeae]|nr:hypothetical protein [Corynebacterium suranareeae]
MNNFEHSNASIRLQAALSAGTTADTSAIDILVQRSGVEQDFFVRDMITWALTRMPAREILDRVVADLDTNPNDRPFGASQALHTLSKLKVADSWQELKARPGLLHRDDTAQTAWRTFVGLVPEEDTAWLAGHLFQELDKGTLEIQRSLSRAMAELEGREASISELLGALTSPHAVATAKLIADPDSDFMADLEEARRVDNMGAC